MFIVYARTLPFTCLIMTRICCVLYVLYCTCTFIHLSTWLYMYGYVYNVCICTLYTHMSMSQCLFNVLGHTCRMGRGLGRWRYHFHFCEGTSDVLILYFLSVTVSESSDKELVNLWMYSSWTCETQSTPCSRDKRLHQIVAMTQFDVQKELYMYVNVLYGRIILFPYSANCIKY